MTPEERADKVRRALKGLEPLYVTDEIIPPGSMILTAEEQYERISPAVADAWLCDERDQWRELAGRLAVDLRCFEENHPHRLSSLAEYDRMVGE